MFFVLNYILFYMFDKLSYCYDEGFLVKYFRLQRDFLCKADQIIAVKIII